MGRCYSFTHLILDVVIAIHPESRYTQIYRPLWNQQTSGVSGHCTLYTSPTSDGSRISVADQSCRSPAWYTMKIFFSYTFRRRCSILAKTLFAFFWVALFVVSLHSIRKFVTFFKYGTYDTKFPLTRYFFTVARTDFPPVEVHVTLRCVYGENVCCTQLIVGYCDVD